MAPLDTPWIPIDNYLAGLIVLCCAIVGAVTYSIVSVQVIINHNDMYRFINQRAKALPTSEVTNEVVKAYLKECRALLASGPIIPGDSTPTSFEPPPYDMNNLRFEHVISGPIFGKQLFYPSPTPIASHCEMGKFVEKA